MTELDLQQLLASIGFPASGEVSEIGTGAWSTAYGFEHDGADLVIRIGAHERDFRKDQAMAAYASAQLPIPAVHDVGQVPGSERSYCISDRAHGTPLEECSAADWPALVESMADALEALRAITPPVGHSTVSWHEQLLDVERGGLDERLPGWRTELATSSSGQAAFRAGVEALEAIDLQDTPVTLLHGDLINRNVHVVGTDVTGIFDWGCQRWGDHLFELDWFEFWAPWHPNIDVGMLRAALERRWKDAEYVPNDMAGRSRAHQLQIAIDHLAYYASVRRWTELDDIVGRMEQLSLI